MLVLVLRAPVPRLGTVVRGISMVASLGLAMVWSSGRG